MSERTDKSLGRTARDWLKSVLIAFALFLGVRTFLAEAFKIPTGSMENTLMTGDFLVVNKAVYGARIPGTSLRLPAFAEPEGGDVIVFTPPHDPGKTYVKRIIGTPGDMVGMQAGRLYVNNLPVDEPYALPSGRRRDEYHPGMGWQTDYSTGNAPFASRPTRNNWGPIQVPQARYFVLGDNRDNSEDSRYWGFVHRDSVRGRPWFVYYSVDPGAGEGRRWIRRVRWNRIGGIVR